MRPLEGLRVLDLSRLLPGPFASMVLADLGAQVDKLEDPKGGDYLRGMPAAAPDGVNAVFHGLNRSKRSLVLDLKSEAGQAAFRKLIRNYDVLLESFRPGVMKRFGLDYESLKAIHPGLIYCAITGFGQDGPAKNRAGHDLNFLARAGVLGVTGPSDGPPQVPGVQLADIGGGALYGVVGILAALQGRSQSGGGSFVDISMAEGAASFALFGFGCRSMGLGRGQDMLMGGIAPYRTYETSDGRHMALASLEPKFWSAFCAAAGIEVDMRALVPGPHQPEWIAKLEAVFAGKDFAAWCTIAEEVDCCLEAVLTPEEAEADAQHRHRGLFERRPVTGGDVLHLRTPVAPPAEGPAPAQGEQSEAILAEAGFTPEEIAGLVKR